MRVHIRRQVSFGQWHVVADVSIPSEAITSQEALHLPHFDAAENDRFAIRFEGAWDNRPDLRVSIGSMLVASTINTDRVERILPDPEERYALSCFGAFLQDWVGLTELVIELRPERPGPWIALLVLPLSVSAGKISVERFEQLFLELERYSASVLFDIHGKTWLGLKGALPPTSAAPSAVLMRLRETIGELDRLLHRVARQPASRLRITTSREEALPGQAVSELTLAEACRDPSILRRHGSHVVFAEHVRERSQIDYRLPEHQVIADFSEYLKGQFQDLRQRIDYELEERKDRKRWRNHSRGGGRTWWETEDQPRIEELDRHRAEINLLQNTLAKWRLWPFLPAGRALQNKPRSTPLFRNHPVYRQVFRVLSRHFLAFQTTLDTQPLLMRVRSLPVLYEWWCAVRVIGILARGLTPLSHDPLDRPIIAREERRFTIEFSANQVIAFTDNRGMRVRFRYQPEYPANRPTGPVLLDSSSLRTPDLAIEIFSNRNRGDVSPQEAREMPELILVMDAKYSSVSQHEKMLEVMTKYSKIGDRRTGRVLSRQVWALTPTAPAELSYGAELKRLSTVDNVGFWSENFDIGNPVAGAVRALPTRPGEHDPLEALVVKVLRLAGVDYRER